MAKTKEKNSKVKSKDKVKSKPVKEIKINYETYNVAVVGVTGLVGEAFLEVLQERQFPVNQFYPIASERSAGKKVEFNGKQHSVINIDDFDFSKVEFAFFSAGADIAEKYAPIAAREGCVVIDNSSQFRYDPEIPLIVPEVNPHQIENYREHNIIANPNCSTIQLVVALKPIYDAVGITRINVATYQSVSGAGKLAVDELAKQTIGLLNNKAPKVKILPKRIAFNVIPQCDVFQDNGYTKEEMKIIWETRKILEDENILINPTAARVPVFYGHSEAVHIETERAIDASEAREILQRAPGIIVLEDEGDYPTLLDLESGDAVYVGRIRKDLSHPMGLNFWVVADNIRKGAALNAVQIAELIINQNINLH